MPTINVTSHSEGLEHSKNGYKKRERIRSVTSYVTNGYVTRKAAPSIQGEIIILVSLHDN